ncbi:serine/threonine-protein kinase [Paludisphaera mucosa]|uniref:Serine/threonine-protein kinase n=1 Tax=Paludisphaera mucosa TaxID=3030827 RepID=A0ABT6FBS5_9BACT|nr:serine/threonine-protein kinase [Paludisphaera mucosa]MDG3005043.1 serine/threonine-protein kinase [Paludisphaera mucosa]
MQDCPSDETLLQLADDDLEPGRYADLEVHIAGCLRCQSELESRAWNWPSTLADDLGRPPRRGAPPQIPGFAIERELGRGAMGVVYLARRDGLDRLVALKVVGGDAGPGDDPGARRRWLAEARAASSVRHPNVVSLHEYGEAGGWLYLVLEYVPGGSLRERMDGPLPPRDAAALVAAVALGVEHVHACGLLHLDLKPSNILVDGPPGPPSAATTPRVADFGLARPGEGPGTTASSLAGPRGTPSYMAPEQIFGPDGLGPAADVHALGAILYEALTGRPPFRAATVFETLEQVRDQEPASPRAVNSRVDRDLDTIVMKCLRKEPHRRYASAAALADDLRRRLDGRPILARPVPLATRTWRLVKRHPWASASVVAAALALAVGVASIVAAKREAERHLALATTGMKQFTSLVLATYYGHQPLAGERLTQTAGILREQIGAVRAIPGVDAELLIQLSLFDGQVAGRLSALKRFDEARVAGREMLDLLRECLTREGVRAKYPWAEPGAHCEVGRLELEAGRVQEALDYLDRATSLILADTSQYPQRGRLALVLAGHYRKAEAACGAVGDGANAARAHESRTALLAPLTSFNPSRPDEILQKANALSELERWHEARRLIEDLTSSKGSFVPFSILAHLEALQNGAETWFRQEIRHWRCNEVLGPPDPKAFDREADRLVRLLMTFHEKSGREATIWSQGINGLHGELFLLATEQRKCGRIDQADATAAMTSAIARSLLRERPGDPYSHAMLGHAYVQENKNAWKREDIPTVRRTLELAIQAYRRAVAGAPDDPTIRTALQNCQNRLAALPKP